MHVVGAGKSIIALEIIRRLGYKALILCHTQELCQQFKDYVVDNLGMKKGEYGIIAGGKIEIRQVPYDSIATNDGKGRFIAIKK